MTLIPGVGALIVFLLTENMRHPMVWTDRWTLLMVLIGVIQLLLALLCLKREKEQAEDEAWEQIISTEQAQQPCNAETSGKEKEQTDETSAGGR